MEVKNKIEKLLAHLKEYAETRTDLITINVQDKLSSIVSSAASMLILTILTLFLLLFLSLGASWWIGQYFESASIGFFSIAGFYLIIILVIFYNRDKWIKLPIINGLIKKINFNEED